MLRALTIHRPFAWAIFHGKPVENRTWAPPESVIGQRIAIHAGLTLDEEGAAFVRKMLGLRDLPDAAHATGVIGVVRFDRVVYDQCADCLSDGRRPACAIGECYEADEPSEQDDPILESPWFSGPYGWVTLDHRELVTPIPCRGYQRLWTLPTSVERQVIEQLGCVA